MAYITKEYLENNIKNYDQYRKLDKEGQANGLATLDANGKLVSSQIPSGVGAATYNGSPVTSIVAGSNTAMSLTNGALTIASTAAGNGNVPAYTSADARKILTVNNNGTSAVWAEGPFYKEGTSDNDKFTFAVEEAKTATKTNVYVTITCPTNVIFAQLDCPATIEGVLPTTVPVRSLKNDSGKQVINIKNDNVDTSFDGDSIKAGKPAYAYLRFTTEAHTYNATIEIEYIPGLFGADGKYVSDIII